MYIIVIQYFTQNNYFKKILTILEKMLIINNFVLYVGLKLMK
jgi:hypothetical protein